MYHHAGQVIKYIQLAMISSCTVKQMQSKPYEMGGKSVLSIGEEKLDQEHWLPWTVDTMAPLDSGHNEAGSQMGRFLSFA